MIPPEFTVYSSGMKWYCDGIPVDELKRRYEAHDALVAALVAAYSCLPLGHELQMVIDSLAAAGVKT